MTILCFIAGPDGLHKASYSEELEAAAALSSTDVSANKPSMLSIMGHAIKQVQAFDRLKSQAPQYKPTPIAGRRVGNVPRKFKVHAPEYKPTPLNVLKKIPSQPKPGTEYDPVNNFSTREQSQPLVTASSRVTLGEGGKQAVAKRQHSSELPTQEILAKKLKPSISTSSLEVEAKFSDDEDQKPSVDGHRTDDNNLQTKHNSDDIKAAKAPDKQLSDSSHSTESTDRENIFEKLIPSARNNLSSNIDTSLESQKSHEHKEESNKEETEATSSKEIDKKLKTSETNSEKENRSNHHSHREKSTSDKDGHRSRSHSSSSRRHSSGKSRQSSSDGKHSSSKSSSKHSSHNDNNKSKSTTHSDRGKESSHHNSSHSRHCDKHSCGDKHKSKHSTADEHKRKHSSADGHKSKHSSADGHKHNHSSHSSHEKCNNKHDHPRSDRSPDGKSSRSKSSHNSHAKHTHSKDGGHKSGSSHSTSSKSRRDSHSKDFHHSHSQSKEDKHKSCSPRKRKQRTVSVSHSDLFGDDSDSETAQKDVNGVKTLKAETVSLSESDVDSVILMDEIEMDLSEDDAYDECLKLYKEEDKRCKERKQAADLKVILPIPVLCHVMSGVIFSFVMHQYTFSTF